MSLKFKLGIPLLLIAVISIIGLLFAQNLSSPDSVSVAASDLPAACAADYDSSGTVDIADFSVFAQNYKQNSINCNLDITGNNCYLDIADFQLFAQIYKSSNACVASTSATPYYYGVFEDGQLQTNASKFATTINDLKAHNMNAILFTNTQPDLTTSDNLGFNVVAAPMNLLYSHFYKSNTPVSLNEARDLLYPVVDNLKDHPSLIGYNIHDDSIPEDNAKMEMITQVFAERDSKNPITELLITGRLAQEVYSYLKPKAYLSYDFPFKANSSSCQVFKGNKDWIYSQRESFQLKPANQPLWMVLQAHKTIPGDPSPNDSSGLRQPTPTEMSIQHWEAVGEEANGIFWYTYSTSPFPEDGQYWNGLVDLPSHYAMANQLATSRKQLDPYLSTAQKIPDRFKVSGDNYISTLKSKTQNVYYIIAVNQSCSQQNLKITSDYFTGSLKDLSTNQTYSLGNNISFAAGEGKMFQLTSAGTKTPPSTQANPIQNPSFESGTSNWSTSGSGSGSGSGFGSGFGSGSGVGVVDVKRSARYSSAHG